MEAKQESDEEVEVKMPKRLVEKLEGEVRRVLREEIDESLRSLRDEVAALRKHLGKGGASRPPLPTSGSPDRTVL